MNGIDKKDPNETERRRLLHTQFARTLRKPFFQAVRAYRLVAPGDRIAVCLSGGKDSFLLALLMQELQKQMQRAQQALSLVFLTMNPGYTPAEVQQMQANAAAYSLPLEMFHTDVLRIVERHAEAHPCFLCAKMRRGYLYAEAQNRGCNKIALGHHYDDAVSTVLMGLLYGGQVQAMLPRVQAAHYPNMELIRPLCGVRERAITAWAQTSGLQFTPCRCPAQQKNRQKALPSQRAVVRELIASLAADNPQVEANILNAVKNVDTRKVLGWRDATGSHSFLDAWNENESDAPDRLIDR